MKIVKVVAGIVKKDDKIFITKRGYGEFKDMWEFPGGKIEKGESREEALKREIKEELELEIKVCEFFKKVEYEYENFFLEMDCFLCEIIKGEIKFHAHNEAKWSQIDDLDNNIWVPADIQIVEELKLKF